MTARAKAAQGERDANHADIAHTYEQLMCRVLDLSTVGRGCPDVLVSIPTGRGRVLQLVEVKTEDGVISESQRRFERDFGSVTVVRSASDVITHVHLVQMANRL